MTELVAFLGGEWRVVNLNTPTGLPIEGTYPDASNTGHSGTLTNFNGDRTISGNNVVVENQNINGRIQFDGTGGVLRNCRLTVDTFWPVVFSPTTGTPGLIENCTIIVTPTAQAAISGGNFTVRRCNISGGPDGIKVGSNSIIEDNYIHSLGGDPAEGFHHDGIQVVSGKNLTIRHNTILVSYPETSCIFISPDDNIAADNVLVQDNLLAGAGYSIYGTDGNIGGVGTNVRVLDNHFSTMYYPNGGNFGPVAYWAPASGEWSGNVWHDGPNEGQAVNA